MRIKGGALIVMISAAVVAAVYAAGLLWDLHAQHERRLAGHETMRRYVASMLAAGDESGDYFARKACLSTDLPGDPDAADFLRYCRDHHLDSMAPYFTRVQHRIEDGLKRGLPNAAIEGELTCRSESQWLEPEAEGLKRYCHATDWRKLTGEDRLKY